MKRLMVFAVLALFIACSSQSDLLTNKPRTFRFSGQQFDSNTALVIPEEISQLKHVHKEGSQYGSSGGYNIDLGGPLFQMLVSMTRLVYKDLTVFKEMPPAGQFDTVIIVSKKMTGVTTEGAVDSGYDVSPLTFDVQTKSQASHAKISFKLVLDVKSINSSDLSVVKTRTLESVGNFNSISTGGQTNITHSQVKVTEAVKDAINMTGEKLANLLGSGFAEVR